MPQANVQPVPLAIIRSGLVAAMLMFGVVIWFTHPKAAWAPGGPEATIAGYAQIVMAIGAVVVAFVMRGRVAREPVGEKRSHLLIVCWAIGEAPALLGGVIFMLAGSPQAYAIGLLAMFICLALLPIQPRV